MARDNTGLTVPLQLEVTLNVPVTEIPQLLMGSCFNLHRVIPIPILLIHLVIGLLPLL